MTVHTCEQCGTKTQEFGDVDGAIVCGKCLGWYTAEPAKYRVLQIKDYAWTEVGTSPSLNDAAEYAQTIDGFVKIVGPEGEWQVGKTPTDQELLNRVHAEDVATLREFVASIPVLAEREWKVIPSFGLATDTGEQFDRKATRRAINTEWRRGFHDRLDAEYHRNDTTIYFQFCTSSKRYAQVSVVCLDGKTWLERLHALRTLLTTESC